MNFVNHGSTRRLAGRFLGSEGMKLRGVYLIQAEEEKGKLFDDEVKLSG
jgi:hypothetical protein